MVARIPPEDDWSTVSDSTLVRSISFDSAAERIFVRLIPQGLIVFEDCSETVWRRFCVEGISKGAYVSQVLMQHRHTRF